MRGAAGAISPWARNPCALDVPACSGVASLRTQYTLACCTGARHRSLSCVVFHLFARLTRHLVIA
eukprot:15228493-Alexandrium_andersonii.AAC.1